MAVNPASPSAASRTATFAPGPSGLRPGRVGMADMRQQENDHGS